MGETALREKDVIVARLPEGLVLAIDLAWRTNSEMMFSVFEGACDRALKKEVDFGTMNENLSLTYSDELMISEDIVERLSNMLGNVEMIKKDDCIGTLRQVLGEHNNNAKTQTLHGLQQRRLFAAVHSAFEIEKKTFVDAIFKETRDSILRSRKSWID